MQKPVSQLLLVNYYQLNDWFLYDPQGCKNHETLWDHKQAKHKS